jgi:EmrB/QacA subfamily drug resistance transporter
VDGEPAGTAVAPSDTRKQRTHNPWVTLAIVLAAAFMQLVDVSIVNVAIPSIQRELHATYGSIQLVLVFYSLAFACCLITSARLGDIYGRRRLFLIGMTGFTIASALCGAAPVPEFLVASRFLQGLTASLMFPQVLSIIQVTFPPRERGRAFAAFGAVVGIATILGPLLGGALIQLNILNLDWRTIFYVNVPIGIVALVAARRQLEESKAPEADRLDLPGAMLVTLGLFLLVYPLATGRDHGWPLWIFLMMAASIPVLYMFVRLQLRKTAERSSPLVQMGLFHDRAFTRGSLLMLVFFLGLPPFFFIFAVYMQIGLGFTALGSGLSSVGFAIGSAIAASRSDIVARRIGNNVLSLGAGLMALGMALILLTVHLVGITPHAWQYLPAFLVAGIGLGLFVAPVVNIILAGIHAEGAGSASGVLSSTQQIGGALGIAIIGVIFFGLIGVNAPSVVASQTPQLTKQLSATGLAPQAVDGILTGYKTCFNDKAHAKDPTANPPSCQRLQQQAAAIPAPPALKQQVNQIITAQAAPKAVAHTFSRSFQQTLIYEITIYLIAFCLVFMLPKVNPHEMEASPGVGGG